MVPFGRRSVNTGTIGNDAMHAHWLNRWKEGRIGWHEPGGNRALQTYWRATGRNVLVPLCGKTPDLKWLCDRGNAVTGVELSRVAAEAFFDEQGLEFVEEQNVLRAVDAAIRIVVGDYFAFDESGFDALYDRASLIALPEGLRPDYVEHTKGRVTDSAAHLLVTLEYDQSQADGPPFSVTGEEVVRYWPDLELVESRDDLDNSPPKFHSLARLDENVWTRNL